jgi:hypothetical protein
LKVSAEIVSTGLQKLAVFKVNQSADVHRFAHEAHFKVQVGTRAVTGTSSQADRVASFDHHLRRHQEAGKVTIDRFQAVGMGNHAEVAVAAGVITRQTHLPVHGSHHRVTRTKVYIQPEVELPPAPKAKTGVEPAAYRNDEMEALVRVCEVDFYGGDELGDVFRAAGAHMRTVPPHFGGLGFYLL